LRWYLDFALLICLRFLSFDSFVLPASSCQQCTLTLFQHKPFFFLNTHGHQFINSLFVLMFIV
jgi:hypothetical protein